MLAIAAAIVLGLPISSRPGFTRFAEFPRFTRFSRFAEPTTRAVEDRAADPIVVARPSNLVTPPNPGNPVNLENPASPGQSEILANANLENPNLGNRVNPGNPVNPVNPPNPLGGLFAALRNAASTITALFEPRARSSASPQTAGTTVAATSERAIQPWDAAIEQMSNDGDLRLRRTTNDTFIAGRAHERFDQYYKGVPVYGGDISRQTDRGTTVSVFGTIYPNIDLDPKPRLSAEEVRVMVEQAHNVTIGPSRAPELVVLPDAGTYRLVYRVTVFSLDGATEYFIDASSGATVLERDALERQNAAAIARGLGVLGDDKKVSVASQSAGPYITWDLLRPPAIQTFDMNGDPNKTTNALSGVIALTTTDLASNPTTTWSDPVAVDAQAYSGLVYDFYFKRFGRQGLDGNNIRLVNIVHPASRATFNPSTSNLSYYINAFYAGGGVMVYGEGLPTGVLASTGPGGTFQSWNYLAGGLDVLAHELTHGVTDFTSNLIYQDESGALNEAFSDIMGTAVEFYYQPPGTGFLKADYLIGEDVITPGGLRSMSDPLSYGYPDNYSLRKFIGTNTDNGGVHTNSSIANHAYFLAIEGGTNRTSRLTVTGVGQANRAQIENVFYRAFTQMMMPSNATFHTARLMTIQAAVDLYGAGSGPWQAVTQAWTAVGVN